MKDWMKLARGIALLTQFGLSLVTPLLLCVGICWWLTVRRGAPGWVFIPGFFLGLGGSFATARRLYLSVTQKDKDNRKKKRGISFNSHD